MVVRNATLQASSISSTRPFALLLQLEMIEGAFGTLFAGRPLPAPSANLSTGLWGGSLFSNPTQSMHSTSFSVARSARVVCQLCKNSMEHMYLQIVCKKLQLWRDRL